MCSARCVLVMVAFHVGVAHSWDIAVSVKEQLIFYTNGTQTDTVNLISQNPTALVYDEIHNMMLYVDKQNSNDAVCGYDLSSKDNKCFIKRNGRDIHGLAFDPATEMIFFTDKNERSINWISLKPRSNNNIYGNLLVKIDGKTPADITVDSCRGYIYWSYAEGKVERAKFNGSERKVIPGFSGIIKMSLFIDLQTQQTFYFDIALSHGYLNKNNLDGTSEKVMLDNLYGTLYPSRRVLTVSKDYIYWMNSSESYDSIWQLPKNAVRGTEPNEISQLLDEKSLAITAKYNIEDQIEGIQDCASLSYLIPRTKVAPGNTGERCEVSACENYCFQGDCSVDDEGVPKCSCNAGYSGERCAVSMCHGYCLNDGDCSLNEEDEPVCQCVGNYEGSRCEIDKNKTCKLINTPTSYSSQNNLTLADLLSNWRKPTARISVTVEV